MLCKWSQLPIEMQTDEVRRYYDILQKKRLSLFCKRAFDIFASLILLIIFAPTFLILAIAIKIDSKGPVFYRQIRITQYGKTFRIHKFRSMTVNSDKGSQITVCNDNRITRVGKIIRKLRIDEISQLIDVLFGDMSFVGTRPEVPKYVEQYSSEMKATLLLPAGITSETSIFFKDEAALLQDASDVDKVYIEEVLPRKMLFNLKSIEKFGFWREIGVIFRTVFAVFQNNDKKIVNDVMDITDENDGNKKNS